MPLKMKAIKMKFLNVMVETMIKYSHFTLSY